MNDTQLKTTKSRIAIFASGSGTNAEAIMDYFKNNSLTTVALLLSNNPEAFALQRAKKFNIPTRVFSKQQFSESGEVLQWLKESHITHVVLAGFLWLIPAALIKEFPNRIVNIHPSLLPRFSGKGMYGMNVHEAVKSAGELITGITIHVVNEHYDDGKILFQENCSVDLNDTPQHIAEKVHALEHAHYPKVIERWIGEGEKLQASSY
jgi:phosphoribosylglycinamide formyltransferase 1